MHTASGYNVDLFYQVMHEIMTDPKSWDQGHWGYRSDCGTRHCVAGWTMICAGQGHQLLWSTDEIVDDRALIGVVEDTLYSGEPIVNAASKLLGLPVHQGRKLFLEVMGNGNGSDAQEQVDALWDDLNKITGGEINYLGYQAWLADRG